jgi:uncharacterized protein YndB with AHSA1/START domain
MTAQLNAASVTRSIEVAAPLEHAFEVFTTGIGTWWNPEHHILEAGLAEMVFEPRVGGHIIDRGVDGSECRWARVLAYDPPHRVRFSWDLNLHWQLENRPSTHQRGRGHLHLRRAEPHPGRAHPSPPRPARRGLAGDAGRGRLRLGPRPLRERRSTALTIHDRADRVAARQVDRPRYATI